MEDSQHLCPDCGADYVEAVVNDIASGAGVEFFISCLLQSFVG